MSAVHEPLVEHWRPAPGFPRYEVSDLGRVRNIELDQLMAVRHDMNIARVHLSLAGHAGARSTSLAALMLEAFGHKRPWPGCHVEFANGDRRDCRLENISWRRPKNPRSEKRAKSDDDDLAGDVDDEIEPEEIRLDDFAGRFVDRKPRGRFTGEGKPQPVKTYERIPEELCSDEQILEVLFLHDEGTDPSKISVEVGVFLPLVHQIIEADREQSGQRVGREWRETNCAGIDEHHE